MCADLAVAIYLKCHAAPTVVLLPVYCFSNNAPPYECRICPAAVGIATPCWIRRSPKVAPQQQHPREDGGAVDSIEGVGDGPNRYGQLFQLAMTVSRSLTLTWPSPVTSPRHGVRQEGRLLFAQQHIPTSSKSVPKVL